MSDHEYHDQEDHSVSYRVGLFMIAVLALITVLALFN